MSAISSDECRLSRIAQTSLRAGLATESTAPDREASGTRLNTNQLWGEDGCPSGKHHWIALGSGMYDRCGYCGEERLAPLRSESEPSPSSGSDLGSYYSDMASATSKVGSTTIPPQAGFTNPSSQPEVWPFVDRNNPPCGSAGEVLTGDTLTSPQAGFMDGALLGVGWVAMAAYEASEARRRGYAHGLLVGALISGAAAVAWITIRHLA